MQFGAIDDVGNPGEESGGPTTESLVLPTVGSLLLTGAVASMVCRTPSQPFASWRGLLECAVGFLLVAAAAHAVAIWTVCRVYRAQLRAPVRALLGGTWICAALLPMAVVLAKAGSEWATPVLPAIAVAAVLFIRRGAPRAGREAHAAAPAGVSASLFAFEEPPGLLRTLLPAVVTAALMDAGIAMLLSWQYALAGLLFGVGAAVVLWRVPLRVRMQRTGSHVVMRQTAVAMVLLVIALLPSLGGSGLAVAMGQWLGVRGVSGAPPPVRVPQVAGATGGALSGVILTLPPKPRAREIPPPPRAMSVGGGGRAKPLLIPFDGDYWYFRQPELRPRGDARRVRGDPTKVDVRSTDRAELQMEAHQRLDSGMEVACCGAVEVAVRNRDDRPGLITLEVVLEGAERRERMSLGTRVVPSSVDRARAGDRGMEEMLLFPIAAAGQMRVFDEITVVVRPSAERARMGAKIAIESFTLLPRL